MKKFLSIILCIMLLAGIVTMASGPVVSAETQDDFVYEFSEEYYGMIITDYVGTSKNVSVPAELYSNEHEQNVTVVAIDSEAFKDCTGISSFTLPSGLVYIGKNAFYNTKYYNTASNWEDGLLYIGKYLVAAKTGITSCEIKEGTEMIASYTFRNATALTSVNIPTTLIRANSAAFAGCSDIQKVYVSSLEEWTEIIFSDAEANPLFAEGNGAELYSDGQVVTCVDVENIPAFSFVCCTSITSINISGESCSVQTYAFGYCANLTSISLSDHAYIEDYAFYGCENLSSISAGDYFYAGANAFDETKYYNTESNWDNGTLYIFNCLVATNKQKTSVKVKSGTQCISSKAFSKSAITSVTIPSGVKTIGAGAFENCSSLKKVYASKFNDWVGITFEDPSANPLSNGAALYFNKVKVTSVSIPKNNDIWVGNFAFAGCTSIKTITVPTGYFVSNYAFYECPNIETLKYIKGSTTKTCWEEFAPYYIPTIKTVSVGTGIKEIGDDTFKILPNLTKVILADTVEKIGINAFALDVSLVQIIIPHGVANIGEQAFLGCVKLKYINLPSSLQSVGGNAFYACNEISHVNFAGSKSKWKSMYGQLFEDLGAVVHYMSDGTIKQKTKSPTCSTAGYTSYYCSECKKHYNKVTVAATGKHTSAKSSLKKATLSSNGRTEGTYCSV